MRVSPLLLGLLALVLVAPTASARPVDTSTAPARQDLRSPDARDVASAGNAQRLQDLLRLHAGNPRTSIDPKASSPRYQGLLAQQQYYSSYGKPTPVPSRSAAPDDDSPWLTIGLGVGLIALVAGAVGFAVRTRRRPLRVRVA